MNLVNGHAQHESFSVAECQASMCKGCGEGSWVRILLRMMQCQLLIYEINTNLFFLVKKCSGAGQTTETNNSNSARPCCHKNPVDCSDLKKPVDENYQTFVWFCFLLFYLISQAGREPSLSENDWQRFPEAFQVPARQQEPEKSGQMQKKIDSKLEHGKSSSRDGYGNLKAYVYQ